VSVKQHAVTALVQNETGTINRLVSTFRRRGFSLDSFNAGDCEQPGYSRLTLLLNADEAQLAFVLKQLQRLVDVVEVEDLAIDDRIMREVALVSFDPAEIDREKVLAVASEYDAKIEYDQPHCLVLQYTGPVRLVVQFLNVLSAFPVKEIVRSGPCALKVSP
jgi:acetolactate synthase-1/3 small subunit